jgi:hypothetical protein
MANVELRDLDQARDYLLQGLGLQRVVVPCPATVGPALGWALEVAAGGQPLPPVGFVADLGQVLLGAPAEGPPTRDQAVPPGLPAGLTRTYEDLVLGKVYADRTLERAADALRRYQGRERDRGLAFVVNQMRERAGFAGVNLSPAVLRGLRREPPDRLLAEGWHLLQRDGPSVLLVRLYEELIAAARRTADWLGQEDAFELEHGTALDELGQRLALRQVLQAAATLEAALPRHRPRSGADRREVPTRAPDEGAYPVGGFASLSTRGSLESLLNSQLAYLEPERPDLFDVKYLRGELLYYARDENHFLRRRRTFVFALFPDLAAARFKGPDVPWQHIVLLLALVVAAVHRLTEWLGSDALAFEILFLWEGPAGPPLAPERKLLESLLRGPIAAGKVRVNETAPAEAIRRCGLAARRGLCHTLVLATSAPRFEADGTAVASLLPEGPSLALPGRAVAAVEWEDGLRRWARALELLLQEWV